MRNVKGRSVGLAVFCSILLGTTVVSTSSVAPSFSTAAPPPVASRPAQVTRPPASVAKPLEAERRREVPAAVVAELPEAAPAGDLEPVRILGRVYTAGEPAGQHDLFFHVGAPEDETLERLAGCEEADWDFTTTDGHFEVELQPGTYHVVGENGCVYGSLHVPRDVDELAWTLELQAGGF